MENVALTLKNVKVKKSTGLDKIPTKVLKNASSIIAPSLTFIFSLSLSSGIFIDDWKNARVCPIYKGNDRRDMGNYRPISILPIISKVFEKEVFQQLYHYLKVNSILFKFQSGFRPLHLTVSALIQMCDDWSDNMDKGKLTGVVFLDIRKAFDSVDQSILLEKVQFYGVADRELMWFKSYLTAQQQQCLINGCLSSQGNLRCGVPIPKALFLDLSDVICIDNNVCIESEQKSQILLDRLLPASLVFPIERRYLNEHWN